VAKFRFYGYGACPASSGYALYEIIATGVDARFIPIDYAPSSPCQNTAFFRPWLDGNYLQPLGYALSEVGIERLDDCPPNSCRIDCASAPNGFCCIDNSFTDRLLQIIKN